MKFADLGIGDRVRLRKPHPCGSYEWRVVRLGADIGLKCLQCGRRVLLSRSEVEKRVKMIIERGPGNAGSDGVAPAKTASDDHHG
ncbi:MAG TPA: DUF951 domain-containing protein [Ktedonobacterales bacterium]